MLAHFLRQGLVNPIDHSSLPCFATQAIFSIAISPIVFYLQKVQILFRNLCHTVPSITWAIHGSSHELPALSSQMRALSLFRPSTWSPMRGNFRPSPRLFSGHFHRLQSNHWSRGHVLCAMGPLLFKYTCFYVHDHICWLNVACSWWCQCSSWWWWWRWWWRWRWRCGGYTIHDNYISVLLARYPFCCFHPCLRSSQLLPISGFGIILQYHFFCASYPWPVFAFS